MKQLFILTTVILVSCSNPENKKGEVSGTYTRSYTDEYTTSYDTLSVEKLSGRSEGLYNVQRKSLVQKKWEQKLLPPKMVIKRWTAKYEPETKAIVLQPGIMLHFNKSGEEATLGDQRFKKIN